MKQRNSGYIAIGANINKLQHVESEVNFVKKMNSLFTTCNDKSSIRRHMVFKLKTILKFINETFLNRQLNFLRFFTPFPGFIPSFALA